MNTPDPAGVTWIQLISAAFGGGVAVKFLDILYQEALRHRSHQKDAQGFLESNLDPLLKSADELSGKIRALALTDFADVRRSKSSGFDSPLQDNAGSVAYLFAAFWAQVEAIRMKSQFVKIARADRGVRLLEFLSALEASKNRILKRSIQRAIGESLLVGHLESVRIMTYAEFHTAYGCSTDIRLWVEFLLNKLSATERQKDRQDFLKYGVILHIMLDVLDPKHVSSKPRTGYAHKLTIQSKRDIKHRIQKRYFPKMSRRFETYIGPVR